MILACEKIHDVLDICNQWNCWDHIQIEVERIEVIILADTIQTYFQGETDQADQSEIVESEIHFFREKRKSYIISKKRKYSHDCG